MSSLQEFIANHPRCCFCGARRATQERDHVPPRALFEKKIWPEGYTFPACEECNRGSRLIDQLAAFLARLSISTETDHEEFEKYHAGIKNNAPYAIPIVATNSIEAKKLLRQFGIIKPDDMFAMEVPVAAIEASTFDQLDHLFWKIFCALFYKHTEQIFPPDSVICRVCTTNQIFNSEDPFSWMRHPLIQNQPTLARAGRLLKDQFDYFWGTSGNSFAISFHLRMSIFGVMMGPLSSDDIDNNPSEILLRSPL